MYLGKKPTDGGFVLELILVLVFIVLGLWVPYMNLMVLGLSAWIILFDRGLDHSFDLVFFLLPFTTVFKLSLDGFALFNFVVFAILFRLLMENDWTFSFLGFSPVLAILYVFAGIKDAVLSDCIRFACQIFIGSIIMSNPQFRNSFSVKRKNTMMSLGIIASSVLALMRGFFPRLARMYEGQTRIKLGQGTYYYRFSGIEGNPNMYTVLLSIAIAVYLVYLIEGRIKKSDILCVATLLIFGAMTVSMSFILSVILIFALAFPMLSKRNPKMMLGTLVLGSISMVLAFVLFGDSDAFQTILFRFQSSTSSSADLSSVTTGRSDIWNLYFQFFFQHPIKTLFGYGLNAKLPFKPAHNLYIETIYYLGIFGSILYVAAHVAIYAPSKYTHRRGALYQYLPFMMLLIRGMARCLLCNEKMMCIYLICSLTAIDTTDPEQDWKNCGAQFPMNRQLTSR